MLWILIACQADPEWGVEFGDERLPVVDMHLHSGEWELIPPSTQAFLASRFPFPFSLNPEGLAASVLTGEGVLKELDKGGIEAGMLFAVYAPRTVGVASNEFVGEQLLVDPQRLYGLVSLRVDQWDTDEESELASLEDAVDSYGFVGIKLAHPHQHFRMDDPRYYSIYALAGRRGLPVYLHTGTSPFPGTAQEPAYTDPAYLEEAIALYPDTVFILGHLGFDFINKQHGTLDHCIDLATRYPNVWLEPSALGSSGSDPDGTKLASAMRDIREAGLVDRTIYGSDGPQSPGFAAGYLERTVAAMQAAGYSSAEARLVLSENFYALFGKKP